MHFVCGLLLCLFCVSTLSLASERNPRVPVSHVPDSKSVCGKVLPRLRFGSHPDRAIPLQSFRIPIDSYAGRGEESFWLHQYADNLWGISTDEGLVDHIAQSILLRNNPTPHRRDIFYLFAHGVKAVPVFNASGKKPAMVLPQDLIRKIEELGHFPFSRMAAVVLLSCHSGRVQGKAAPELSPTSAYIAAMTGLPVVAPTGAMVLQLSDPEHGYSMEGFYQLDVEPGTSGWSTATPPSKGMGQLRAGAVSPKELQDIIDFYRQWERQTREIIPVPSDVAPIPDSGRAD
jgi:hypothetical protein